MNGNFGFIHEKIEIKILILFILRRLLRPVSFDVLTELTMCDDGICYFDYAESVAELVETKHLRFEDGKYSLTRKGVRNGEITENSLPFCVRRIVENAASAARVEQSRNAMIRALHTVNPEGGFSVNMSLSDGVGKILSMEMLAADEQQATAMEKGFRKNAENVYNSLAEMLLG